VRTTDISHELRVGRTRLVAGWVRLIRLFAPVLVPAVGPERVLDWAHRGALRLIRVEVIR
jgi:hypothetical protein